MNNIFGKPTEKAEESGLTENEQQATQGEASPATIPTFAKHEGQDENVRVTDSHVLDEAKQGANAQSQISQQGPTEVELEAAEAAKEGDSVEYVANRIARLKIGRFQFEHGRLSLSPKDAEEFDKFLASADPRTQNSVQKIDARAGEAVAREFARRNQGHMTRGGETSASSASAVNPADQKHEA